MTSILLHDYVEQIDKLIDDNRLVEAIEHCRHVLHHYPRHIDTYRVMGKALLEKQEYDAANDLFLRILGADPNDFISHVGLSIIYKEESQFDQALWHLERAYEIQPYNVAIQGELRQLYAAQTDERLGIIPLTRGALVRLYMQGELYQQAITELRRILAEEPERMDLQVLLAEALWRDDQRIDAEEVCLNVLDALPNCIVANAILAEIWLQTGRIPEAQKYLHRLHSLTWKTEKSLDKETIVGRAFATEGAFPLPKESSLEFLYTGTVMPEKRGEPTADWVGEVSFDNLRDGDSGLDEVVIEPESGMHSYDWLADIGDSEAAEPEETAAAADVPSETDWFSQGKVKESLKLSTSELDADWLADLRGEAEEEADFQPLDLEGMTDELPDDLTAVDSDWFGTTDEPAAGADTAVPAEPAQVDSEGLPNWLDSLGSDDSAIEIDATNLMDDSLMNWADSEPHIVKESNTPLWLSEIPDDELEAVQLSPEDALDWMMDDEDEEDAIEPEALVDEFASEPAQEAALEDDLSFLDEVELPIFEDAAPEEPEFGPTAVLDEAELVVPDFPLEVSDTDALGGADDWLAALTGGAIDETIEPDQTESSFAGLELDATTSELAALSDSDDWLESAEADLDAILQSEAIEDIYPNLDIPELDDDDFANIPDWLDSEDDLSEESEAAVSSENDPQQPPKSEKPKMEAAPEEDPTADVLNWLDELTSDKADSAPLSEPPIETEGMPSWLNTAAAAPGLEVIDEWDSASADIPDWLQEPVNLADLEEDDQALDQDLPDDGPGLTGLLSQIDVSPATEMGDADDALPMDQMDLLLTDWGDEPEGLVDDWLDEIVAEETAVPTPADEEPEEIGLTGLLSNLTLTEPEPPRTDDDFMSGFLDEIEDDEGEADFGDTLGLTDLGGEDFSLTGLLAGMDDAGEADDAFDTADSDDDWLADLVDITEAEEPEEAPTAEKSMGLTGMLASLWDEDDTAEAEPSDIPSDFDTASADEMGLTELLAGIDYEEDAIASEFNLGDFDIEPVEPSLTQILSGIEVEPEDEDEDSDLPVSAEDTTWLAQLEADTGALQEAGDDDFNMAEETGLDWLTLPDEPEAVQPEQPKVPKAEQRDVVVEPDSTPEDWDDPMAWLEELAAQQEDPVGELPSVAETMLDEELDSADQLMAATAPMSRDTDWLAELTGGDIDADDDLDDWLAETEADALAAELLDEAETSLDLPETQAMAETEPDDLADLENLDDLFGDAGEVSWLDELATDMLEQSETAVAEPEEPVGMDSLPREPEMAWADEAWPEEPATGLDLEDLWPEDEQPDDALFAADFGEPVVAEPELAVAETAVPDDEELSWLDTVLAEPDEEADEFTWPETAAADAELADEAEEWPGLEELDMPEEAAELAFTAEAEMDLAAEDEAADEPGMPDEELVIIGVTDALKETGGLTQAEADLEEAMAWLDELDEEPELALPDEAPPTRVNLSAATAVPEPEPELFDAWPDVDEEPETIIVEPEEDELAVALDRLEQKVRQEGVAVPETAVFPLALSTEELNAALDWIEEAEAEPEVWATAVTPEPAVETWDAEAFDEDEEPDLQLDDAAVDVDLQAMADDPEAWLEQLLSDDGDMDIEMEPPPIKPSDDAMFVTDDAALMAETAELELPDEPTEAFSDEQLDSLLDDVGLDEIPEDPDAAVGWIYQMVDEEELDDATALDAESGLDDLLLIEAETADSAELDADAGLDFDMGDDPEAWLEQMLSGDMTLDIDMEPPPIKPSEDAMFVTGDARAAVVEPEPEAEPELLVTPELADEWDEDEEDEELGSIAEAESDQFGLADMMDDPEAWLEQLLNDGGDMDIEMEPPPIKPSEDAMFVTDNAPARTTAPEPEPEWLEPAPDEPLPIEPDIISEMPEDDEASMVWLEQLAARQGAALDELPTVQDVDAEPEMPDWMAQDFAALTDEDDLAQEEMTTETAVPIHLPTEPGPGDDDIDAELPDWLDRRTDESIISETGWLRALPDVDMETWLAAEEEATLVGPVEEIELPDTGPLRSPAPPPTPEPLDDVLFEPVLEPSTGAYSVDEARLIVARAALRDGRLAEALTQFKELVAEGTGMMTIIAELEQATDAHPRTPALSQVLGDAYMRNGQLQKALASYRTALDQM